jgi:subtilisin family serine protease
MGYSMKHRLRWSIVAAAGVVACGKSDPGPDDSQKPSQLVLVEGNNQTGRVGEALQTALTVRVVNSAGAALAGIPVAFAVTAGGGSVTNASVNTAVSGQASTVWVLGGTIGAGLQRVTASAAGVASVTFTATGLVGAPASVAVTSGGGQRAPLGAPAPDSIRVVVKDQFDNPTEGIPITWQVIAGGGSVSPTATVTDAQGRTAARLVLGPSNAAADGNQLLIGVTGSGVSTIAFATGQLTTGSVTVVSGDQQTGSPSSPLLAPLRAVVKTGAGATVQGVPVDWVVVTGGGTVDSATTTTDASGAVYNRWRLGPAGGQQSVRASVATLTGPPLTMTATALVPPPGVITGLVGEPSQFTAPPVSVGAAPSFRAAAFGRVGGAIGSGEPYRLPFRHPRPSYSPNTLIVRFRAGPVGAPAASGAIRSTAAAAPVLASIRTQLARLTTAATVRRSEISPAILAARLTVRGGANLDSMARALAADPSVASVKREEIVWADGFGPRAPAATFAPMTTPNDPLYPNQSWHYVMIDLPRAWTITTGSASVVVAVLDTGIRFDHPVFAGNLTTDGYDFVPTDSLTLCAGGKFDNAGDGNGYDNDPTQPSDRSLDNNDPPCWGPAEQFGGHGLHTAGTIGAAGNDDVGGTGVNWRVKIRSIRVLGVGGQGRTFDIAQGILYAAGLPASDGSGGTIAAPTPARIINMSLGGTCNSAQPSEMHDAITAATNAGVLVVVSAGNSNNTATQSCPAGYPEPITVAAIGPLGTKASYSNFGTPIDIAAPGGDLNPATPDGTYLIHSAVCDFRSDPCIPGYARFGGTSMAAPHVSGVAALLLAQNPNLTVSQLRDRLLNFAVDAGAPGPDIIYGHGILNARNSLTQTTAPAARTYARLYHAVTGALVTTVPASGGGAFTFNGVAPGDYWVFAGQDEDNDGVVGAAGRRWTAFGGIPAPTLLRTTATGGASAFFLFGTAQEAEPNDDRAHASRLVVSGWVFGEMQAGDPADFYRIEIPVAGTYTFETSGFGGSYCRFALELNTKLALQDSQGVELDNNDDIDPKEGASLVGNRCSRIRRQLTPGTYYLVVQASGGTNPNNPGIHTGRYRLEARAGQ